MPILGTVASGYNLPLPVVTGGTLYTSGGYNYRVFTSSGALEVTNATLTADILVVAGGASGGGQSTGGGNGGGGGAGGYLTFTSQSLTAQAYTVTVGAGGAIPGNNDQGTSGNDSQFGALTLVKGGGGGGSYANENDPRNAGVAGGSGGGVGQYHVGPYNTGGAAFPEGQGNAGGSSYGGNLYAGGGGGGAGAAGGTAAINYVPGVGGIGLANAISGGATTGVGELVNGLYYLSGGGGGGPDGNGGSGGGGKGGSTNAGVAGTANTGGGGGGGEYSVTGKLAGAGGSGIVIVRYAV
jgi:hypothetical protein